MLCDLLADLEAAVLDCTEPVEDTRELVAALRLVLPQLLSQHAITHDGVQRTKAVLVSLDAIVRALAEQHRKCTIVVDTGLAAVKQLLTTPSLAYPLVADPFSKARHYFITHLAYPYPSTAEKREMLDDTSDVKTIQNFFVNNRKRSGWTDLYRLHAGADPLRMAELIANIENPCMRWSVDQEAVKQYERVKAWFYVDSPIKPRAEQLSSADATS